MWPLLATRAVTTTRRLRWLQLLVGVYRIHHEDYSYGWKIQFVPVGWFDDNRLRWIRRRGEFHNCTLSGVY